MDFLRRWFLCFSCLVCSSALLFSVQHHSLLSLDCFPQSRPYTGFNNQQWEKVFNPSQLADPSTPTAKIYVRDLHAKMSSHSTIPTRNGKQSLNLSWKVVFFRILSSAYLCAQDRAERGQPVVWLQMNFKGHSKALKGHCKACVWMKCLFDRTEKLCMLDIHSRTVRTFLLRTL